MFQICLPGLDVAMDPSVKHSPRIPHPVLTISYWGFWCDMSQVIDPALT